MVHKKDPYSIGISLHKKDPYSVGIVFYIKYIDTNPVSGWYHPGSSMVQQNCNSQRSTLQLARPVASNWYIGWATRIVSCCYRDNRAMLHYRITLVQIEEDGCRLIWPIWAQLNRVVSLGCLVSVYLGFSDMTSHSNNFKSVWNGNVTTDWWNQKLWYWMSHVWGGIWDTTEKD